LKDHFPEYLAEFAGTAIMMAIGVGAIAWMWAEGSVMREIIPSEPLRRLATGILFAGGATLVVISRLGQRSGGHLNPAMTLAFWWKGQVGTPDLFGYVAAQVAGALLGVWIVAMVGGAAAESVRWGITLPGAGYGVAEAFLAEAVITFLLVFLVLYCVSNERFAKATPFLAGSLVAFLVLVEAPISGTGLNPARSLAPALISVHFEHLWLYVVAPVLGALAAVLLINRVIDTRQRPGCAKLFHTERYRCIFLQCAYEVFPAGTVVMREGDAASVAYVIEEGELEIRKHAEDGSERVLSRLGPGEWAGELGVLLRLPRSATVVAIRDSRLRLVTEQNFKHVIAEHPAETERLLRQLAHRVHETSAQLVI
jgi:aquaporin Z